MPPKRGIAASAAGSSGSGSSSARRAPAEGDEPKPPSEAPKEWRDIREAWMQYRRRGFHKELAKVQKKLAAAPAPCAVGAVCQTKLALLQALEAACKVWWWTDV